MNTTTYNQTPLAASLFDINGTKRVMLSPGAENTNTEQLSVPGGADGFNRKLAVEHTALRREYARIQYPIQTGNRAWLILCSFFSSRLFAYLRKKTRLKSVITVTGSEKAITQRGHKPMFSHHKPMAGKHNPHTGTPCECGAQSGGVKK